MPGWHLVECRNLEESREIAVEGSPFISSPSAETAGSTTTMREEEHFAHIMIMLTYGDDQTYKGYFETTRSRSRALGLGRRLAVGLSLSAGWDTRSRFMEHRRKAAIQSADEYKAYLTKGRLSDRCRTVFVIEGDLPVGVLRGRQAASGSLCQRTALRS